VARLVRLSEALASLAEAEALRDELTMLRALTILLCLTTAVGCARSAESRAELASDHAEEAQQQQSDQDTSGQTARQWIRMGSHALGGVGAGLSAAGHAITTTTTNNRSSPPLSGTVSVFHDGGYVYYSDGRTCTVLDNAGVAIVSCN